MNKGLKVGIAKVDITPPVGIALDGNARNKNSQGIHDKLYTRVLIFDSSSTIAVIVTLDLLGVYREFVHATRKLIEKQTGIKNDNILICCSHTHSGPSTLGLFCDIDESWLRELSRKIAGAVYMAQCSMKKAWIGVGKGKEETLGCNRRLRMIDGSIKMNWEDFNPGEIVGPAGPIDPEVGVIRIEDSHKDLLACLINFNCHPCALTGNNFLISADYPGYTTELIERIEGNEAIVLFTNGALGNIDVIDPQQRHGFGEARRMGFILAGEVLKVLEKTSVDSHDEVKLNICSEQLELPLRDIPKADLEKAKKLIKEFDRKEISLVDGASEEIFADEIIRLDKIKEKKNKITIEIQIIAINKIILVGIPGEMFVELGLEIKKKSGFKHTFIVGLANDYVGYIPTKTAFGEGGYTIRTARWSKLIPEAGPLIVSRTLDLINKIYKSGMQDED